MHPSLLLLADGRFPAGGHAYSAGVESAVSVGDVRDVPSLERYLDGRLETGVVDAAFAAGTAAAVAAGGDSARFDDSFEARIISPRLRTISRQLGRQMVRAAAAVWPHDELLRLGRGSDGPHHAVALGAAVAAAGGMPADAAVLTQHHLAAAVCTAGVRLLGLDPIAVAVIQARVAGRHRVTPGDVAGWVSADPHDLPSLGGSLTEILGEAHGSWEARLFVA